MSTTTQHPIRNLLKVFLRWGVAIIGLSYVVMNLSWSDYVLVPRPADGLPMKVPLAAPATETAESFTVMMPQPDGTRAQATFRRDQLLVRADRDKIRIRSESGEPQRLDLLALRVTPGQPEDQWPLICVNPRTFWQRYWNQTDGSPVQTFAPTEVADEYHVALSYPLVDRGLKSRFAAANGWYLLLAMTIFPAVFLITTYRWWLLMKAQDISMTMRRAFAINMVGTFWNSFLLGSTGGDVLKAIYAARNTPHRTRAVVSVLVDRAIGLLGLVVLGGSVSAAMWLYSHEPGDAVAKQCFRVAVASIAIFGTAVVGWFVYYTPSLRRLFLIDRIMAKLPLQKVIGKLRESLDLFGHHPGKVLAALVMTIPVHGIVVVSAMLAGQAFGLPIKPWYYFVVVPVVVLSASIPISPQGAGVMEFFAILLTRSQGCTVTDAFTLTMSIRIIQILWNLTGGIFVARGGFSTPKQPTSFIDEVEHDDGKPAE
jgi:glycosyltransferase 2 family protein